VFELPNFNIVPHYQIIIIIIIIMHYSPLWTLASNNSSSISSGFWPQYVNFFFPLTFTPSSASSDHLFRGLSLLHFHPILTVAICFGILSLFVTVRSGFRLQAERSRVRFPMGLLGFFIDLILSAAL